MEYKDKYDDGFDFDLYEEKLYDEEDGIFFEEKSNKNNCKNQIIMEELENLKLKREFAESEELINEIGDLIYWYKEHHNVQ